MRHVDDLSQGWEGGHGFRRLRNQIVMLKLQLLVVLPGSLESLRTASMLSQLPGPLDILYLRNIRLSSHDGHENSQVVVQWECATHRNEFGADSGGFQCHDGRLHTEQPMGHPWGHLKGQIHQIIQLAGHRPDGQGSYTSLAEGLWRLGGRRPVQLG